MRTLVYKQTHPGDPDSDGQFGACDCLGSVRSWEFDAVIGIGGLGAEAQRNGIAGKLNWIGVGARRHAKTGSKHPVLTFDHFVNFGAEGPQLRVVAPKLAKRMKHARHAMNFDGEQVIAEIEKLLAMVKQAPPSPARKSRSSVGSKRPRPNGRGNDSCAGSPASQDAQPASAHSLGYEELHKLAERYPPAAAWFDENLDVL